MPEKLFCISNKELKEILYAYDKPNYLDMFKQNAKGKFSDILKFNLDNKEAIIVLTPDVETLREKMKQSKNICYTIDGSNFNKCGENVYNSKTPGKILNSKIVDYNFLLENFQVFYIDTSKLSFNDLVKLVDYRKKLMDQLLSFEDMGEEEIIINENEVQNVNRVTSTSYGKNIRLNDDTELSYDILINADEIDYDCLQVQDVPEPILKKYKSKSGKRIDCIQCSEIDENSVLINGEPSYQSIEMMIAVNGRANSKIGEDMLNKARKDYPPEYMKDYYYHLSLLACLLAQEKDDYPYNFRKHMILRMIRDFFPKAEALCKTNKYDFSHNTVDRTDYLSFEEKQLYEILQNTSQENHLDGEEAIDKISEIFDEKINEKINNKFFNEFINKLEKFGTIKYLSDNLKTKLLLREQQQNTRGTYTITRDKILQIAKKDGLINESENADQAICQLERESKLYDEDIQIK